MSGRDDQVQALSNSDLRRFLDRLVALEEEKQEAAAAFKEVLEEAEGAGFSKKAMRLLVKREMETADQRAAREQVEKDLELMLAALHPGVQQPEPAEATH